MITIDIETKSDKDISKCGVYAYTDTPYFDILLFAYSIDGQPVQVVDTANGEEIPENVLAALADENVVKRAFNCNFERVCLSKYLRENHPQYFQSYSIDEDTVGDFLNTESWHCSMIHARTLGLPSSLAEVGEVLGIEQQKMTEGKALIKFFCMPYDTIDGVPQFHNPKDLAISISLEAAELLEVFQWSGADVSNEGKQDKIKEELADVVNYCVLMADACELDLDEIVQEKIKINERKYPVERAKGRSDKYDKL